MARAEGSFKTHAAYMAALAGASDLGPWRNPESGLGKVATRAVGALPAGFEQVRGSVDTDQLRRSLSNAWNTELLVDLALNLFDDDETVRVANHWAVIQAYYVMYHLSQALVVARGGDRPAGHPKTVSAYASDWLDRNLELHPWTLGLNSDGWRNVGAKGVPDDTVHQWSSASDHDLIGLLIRTTRGQELDEGRKAARGDKQKARRRAWREEEAERHKQGKKPRKEPDVPLPRLTPAEKARVDRNLGTFGVMHYLWRLRIKSNYLDPDTFIEGPPDTTASGEFLSNARYFLAATGLVYERRIGNLVGGSTVAQWASSWGRAGGPRSSSSGGVGPSARAEILW